MPRTAQGATYKKTVAAQQLFHLFHPQQLLQKQDSTFSFNSRFRFLPKLV